MRDARFDDTVRATTARYRPTGRFAYHYVASKLRRDPAARALFDLASAEDFGNVADLGCGRGQFAACLLQAGLARSVTGLERNRPHLQQARLAMRDLAFTGVDHDLSRDQPLPQADTVMLIDVLYQLGTAQQSAVLQRVAAAVGRRVIIRTADPSRGWRSALTRGLELGFRGVWPNAGARVNAQPTNRIIEILTSCGLRCSITPCWAGTPFANMLLIATKPPATA